MSQTGPRMDRLRRALRVCEAFQSGKSGGSREWLLGEHEDLRDLLEILLSDEDSSTSSDSAAARDRDIHTHDRLGAPRELPEIARFEVLEEIGRGGQGVVYRAVQTATKRVVALKILSLELFATKDRNERFRREIELVSRLEHPNIATLYESGMTASGSPFFALQYIEGRSLAEYRAAEWPRGPTSTHSLRELVGLFIRILDAVEHAHERGIIHRDLKPTNILLDDHGTPHVVDFGLAKALDRADSRRNPTLTHTGQFMGTPAYAAPEQVAGDAREPDERTDIYALGVILFELLCGQLPYPTDSATSEIYRHITRTEPTNPSRINPMVGQDLTAILCLALRKAPQQRYSSVSALRDDLNSFLRGAAVRARRGHGLYNLRKTVRRYRVSASVTMTLILVSLGLLAFSHTLRNRNASLERLNRVLNLARGREMIVGNNVRAGGELLWREHLLRPDRDSQWALRELQHRQPNLVRRCREASGRTVEFPRPPLCIMTGTPSVFVGGSRIATVRVGYEAPIFIDTETLSILDSDFESGSGVGLLCVEVDPLHRLLYGGFRNDVITAWVLDPDRLAGELGARPPPARGTVFAEFVADDSRGSVATIRCRSDGGRIAATWGDGLVHELDPLTLRPGREYRLSAWPTVAYDPRGTELAMRDSVGFVQIVEPGGSTRTLDSTIGPPGLVWIPYRDEIWFGRFNPLSFVDTTSEALLLEYRPFVTGTFEGPGIHNEPFVSSSSGVVVWLSRVFGGRRVSAIDATPAKAPGSSLGERGTRELGLPTSHGTVLISPEGESLFNLAADGVVSRFDLQQQRSPRPLPLGSRCEQSTVHTIQTTPDARYALLGGNCLADDSSWIQVVDLDRWEEVGFRPRAHEAPVTRLIGMADSRSLISTGQDGAVRIWSIPSLEGGEQVLDVEGASPIACAELSDSQTLILGCDDASVVLFDFASRSVVRRLRRHDGRVPSLARILDDGGLVSVDTLGQVVFWDLSRRDSSFVAHFVRPPARSPIRCVRAHRSGAVAAGNDEGQVMLWTNGARGVPVTMSEHPAQIFAATFFEEDGRVMLATGDRSGRILIWDVEEVQLRAAFSQMDGFQMHSASVFCLSTHPDGRRVFSSGELGRAYLWDFSAYDSWIDANQSFHTEQIETD